MTKNVRTMRGMVGTVKDSIKAHLQEADYYAGSQERIQSLAENTADAFATLAAKLHEKGILTDAEVIEFCDYNDKLIDEE